ncbi:MAG: B12-binding domain-containing radical SAM protein [Elusimicrobia bacterium]|nr:B12-binding domain-containing radical SAM protein [Elusimicrobiota bacterium]
MIVLINHQGLKTIRGIQIQTPSPPIGLAYLGGALKAAGLAYTAIDACGEALDQILPYREGKVMMQGLTDAQVVARIPAGARVIGFTCLFSHCWPLVRTLAQAVRARFPDAVFVAGGEHPSAMPEQVLRGGLFDVVVRGEGEETVLELIARLNAGKPWRDVAGIAYTDADGKPVRTPARRRTADIDALPWPDWEGWPLEKYIEQHQVSGIHLGRSMPILGSRGCPYECTFCSNPDMWTRRYIMRDPVGLADEMEAMKKRYGVSGFTFMDSTFIVNREKTLRFAKELIRRGLGVSYQLPAGTRCEAFDPELARALDESGLRNFAFAPESGSVEILKAVKKQIDLDRLLEAARTVLKTRMTVGCFIVIGFPEDTRASMRATLGLIRRLALMGVHDVTVSKFTPYPGSEYFTRLVASGKIGDDMNELDNVIDFYSAEGISYSDTLSSRELYFWMVWMFANFYLLSFLARPWRPVANLWDYFTRGVENARYMRFLTEMLFMRRKWDARPR